MATQIFVNLPVKDLDRSVAFFAKLGFKFDPKFTDEKATCMIVDQNIFVMLLVEEFFRTFTSGKSVCDTKRSAESIVCLTIESREDVDELVNQALAAGGSPSGSPKDHGFMYQNGFQDIDGHLWELVYFNPKANPGA